MIKRSLAAISLGLLGGLLHAQILANDPDWKEAEVPAAPAFDIKRLIPVVITVQSQLAWGVDPQTIKIGSDGVVRYVVVAQSSSGVINAMYEGIRCNTAEFRRYARHNPGSGWVVSVGSEWTSLRQTGASRHPQSLAKLGLCDGAAPPSSPEHAARALRAGGADLAR